MAARTARGDLLVQAAKRIIEREGIKGITFRVVAAEADVPLGSATYYFPTIEDLLVATIDSTRTAHETSIREWFIAHRGSDPGDAVSEYFLEQLQSPVRLASEYELYLAAVSVPSLRPLAASWFEAVAAAFDIVVEDPGRSFALAALLDGWFIQAIVRGPDHPMDPDRIRTAVRRVIAGDRN